MCRMPWRDEEQAETGNEEERSFVFVFCVFKCFFCLWHVRSTVENMILQVHVQYGQYYCTLGETKKNETDRVSLARIVGVACQPPGASAVL